MKKYKCFKSDCQYILKSMLGPRLKLTGSRLRFEGLRLGLGLHCYSYSSKYKCLKQEKNQKSNWLNKLGLDLILNNLVSNIPEAILFCQQYVYPEYKQFDF